VDEEDYKYTDLLERLYNPTIQKRKRYSIQPVQIKRVGTRRTMWINLKQISESMNRDLNHVSQFILSEFATEGSIDSNHRLIVKGKFSATQIEGLIKKYISEYVICRTCLQPNDTTLEHDSITRLFFIKCERCGSKRVVSTIKNGFHATTKADRIAEKHKNC
jgi:translation initiation factor 2 subunit 2